MRCWLAATLITVGVALVAWAAHVFFGDPWCPRAGRPCHVVRAKKDPEV